MYMPKIIIVHANGQRSEAAERYVRRRMWEHVRRRPRSLRRAFRYSARAERVIEADHALNGLRGVLARVWRCTFARWATWHARAELAAEFRVGPEALRGKGYTELVVMRAELKKRQR